MNLLSSSVARPSSFNMLKKTFAIPDMHCAACVMKLESIEDELEGIKQINASYHKQQMEVEFDETKVTEEQILESVKKKGYTVKSDK